MSIQNSVDTCLRFPTFDGVSRPELVRLFVEDQSILTDSLDECSTPQLENQKRRFIGEHECETSQFHGEKWIELWVELDDGPHPDDKDVAYCSWHFSSWPENADGEDLGILIVYCPYCGRNLWAALKPCASGV